MNYNLEYEIACKEVLEILKYIKKDDVSKIPQEEINILKNNAKKDFNCEYDPSINVKEQNISKMAKTIIAIYFIDYIANPEQKRRIEIKQKKDLELLEKKRQEQYSYEKLFNNNANDVNNLNQNVSLIEVKKESLLKKIFKKIKNLFNKK